MHKYEYKTLMYEVTGWWGGKVDAGDVEDRLNELAEIGWEIDHCIPIAISYGQTKSVVFILKREIKG